MNLVKEAGRTPPPFPFIFFKPNTTVHDHGKPVEIPKLAQDEQADYEGELVRIPTHTPLSVYSDTELTNTPVPHNRRARQKCVRCLCPLPRRSLHSRKRRILP